MFVHTVKIIHESCNQWKRTEYIRDGNVFFAFFLQYVSSKWNIVSQTISFSFIIIVLPDINTLQAFPHAPQLFSVTEPSGFPALDVWVFKEV